MSKEKQPWTVTGKSYQIADTGDYDGHYEISNGKITLYTKDEDEGDQSEDQGFEELVAALNKTRATFWTNGDDEAYGYQMEAEHFKREYHAMTTALAAKDAEIERLKNTLHIDQTGLAKGLAAVNKLVDGYWWATEGRGPYEWNDDKYKDEMRNMLENIRNVATEALSSSGTIAHTVCCGKEPRTVTVEDIGYVKKEQADAEIERLKGVVRKAHDSGYVSGYEIGKVGELPRFNSAWEAFKTENNR